MKWPHSSWMPNRSGQTLGEYALIIALLSLGLVIVLVLLRDAIGTVFSVMSQNLSNS